jgi:hypothetical protein
MIANRQLRGAAVRLWSRALSIYWRVVLEQAHVIMEHGMLRCVRELH